MKEEIQIFDYYTLYKDGKLYSIKTKKFLKWSKNGRGYLQANIMDNGKKKSVRQHRLLAQYFILNPENKKEVNHINGIKHDNRLSNLEWITPSENIKHAYINGLKNTIRPCKKVIDISTNKIYESVKDAAKEHIISIGHLSNMLTGKITNKTTLRFYGK